LAIVQIPAWTAAQILPPVDPINAISASRSPYSVSLLDVVLRFATSAERRSILDGFLRYREKLHAAGLTVGFQWLDGSFLENIEVLESRPPNDLDVVTFCELPAGVTQAQIAVNHPDVIPAPALRSAFKANYHVDPYFEVIGPDWRWTIRRGTYWYSVWSHRRSLAWKGYLQVDLNPVDDAAAVALLHAPAPGAHP
jgi:hypothetical protein